MAGARSTDKWRIAREALGDLLTQTPVDVPIAMLTFAGDVRDQFDFSQGRRAIEKWLKEGPQGPDLERPAKTALFDAIVAGLRLLRPVQLGDAIYAITDGGDNASQTSAVQTEAALEQSGVRLFAFLFAQPLLNSEREGKDSFLGMVEDSGGFVFGVLGRPLPQGPSWDVDYIYDKEIREKIKDDTSELNIQVNGFWTLELAAPPSDKESKMKLEIAGRDRRIRKDVAVTYPRVVPATN